MSFKRIRIFSPLMIIVATVALFTSCQYDDFPDRTVGHDGTLEINITAEQFASGNIETRASDISYATKFTSGDRIGITVVKDGTTILEDNIPYEYDGSAWNPVANVVHLYPGTNISHLVYYPYDANMNGKTTAAAIVAAFTPKTDQSNPSDYTASDLMTGTGTLSGTTLTVTLTHALSLIELNFPSGVSSVMLDIDGSATLKPHSFEGAFRYIAKPQDNPVELTGSYLAGSETMLWQLASVMLTAGKYIKINVFILSAIEGYSGGIQVLYTDGSNEIVTIAGNGILKLTDGTGKTIMKIVLLDKGNKEYLIGRETDQPLCLKFDINGNLLFRDAIEGYIPIGSYAEFQKINDNSATRAGNYRQEANIDLMGNMSVVGFWTPVGSNTNRFTGLYDGNNKTISRLSINNTSLNYAGLFGAVGAGGTVKNINITETNVIGGNRVGSLAGQVYSGANIVNCNTNGEVSGTDYIGGLVGYCDGTISICNNSNKVSGGSYVGGIVGYVASGSAIEACNNKGTVNGTGTGGAIRVGGIAGFVTAGSIVNACKSSGMVSGAGNMIGGIAGEVLNGSTVKNCYSTGKVTGVNDVGGVAGCVTNGSTTGFVERCYSVCEVRGVNSVGGVVGLVNSGAFVSNCVALNTIVYASNLNIGRVAYSSGGNTVNNMAWYGISNDGGIPFPGGVYVVYDRMDGKSITANQAMLQATYVDYIASDFPVPLNWDFTTIWTIDEGSGYPALRWE